MLSKFQQNEFCITLKIWGLLGFYLDLKYYPHTYSGLVNALNTMLGANPNSAMKFIFYIATVSLFLAGCPPRTASILTNTDSVTKNDEWGYFTTNDGDFFQVGKVFVVDTLNQRLTHPIIATIRIDLLDDTKFKSSQVQLSRDSFFIMKIKLKSLLAYLRFLKLRLLINIRVMIFGIIPVMVAFMELLLQFYLPLVVIHLARQERVH